MSETLSRPGAPTLAATIDEHMRFYERQLAQEREILRPLKGRSGTRALPYRRMIAVERVLDRLNALAWIIGNGGRS